MEMMYLPSAFVMPYMIGYTDDVEKPMFYADGGLSSVTTENSRTRIFASSTKRNKNGIGSV